MTIILLDRHQQFSFTLIGHIIRQTKHFQPPSYPHYTQLYILQTTFPGEPTPPTGHHTTGPPGPYTPLQDHTPYYRTTRTTHPTTGPPQDHQDYTPHYGTTTPQDHQDYTPHHRTTTGPPGLHTPLRDHQDYTPSTTTITTLTTTTTIIHHQDHTVPGDKICIILCKNFMVQ